MERFRYVFYAINKTFHFNSGFCRCQPTHVHSKTRMANHLPAKYGLQKENAPNSSQLGWHPRDQHSQNVSEHISSLNFVLCASFRNGDGASHRCQKAAKNHFAAAAGKTHFFFHNEKTENLQKKSSWLICTPLLHSKALLSTAIANCVI